jgi:predicted nucleic-acid-binding protein
MRGLDTNVLTRYVVQDDVRQSAAAERVIEDAIHNNEQLYICVVVLCEFVWVLKSGYDQPKPKIIAKLDEILSIPEFSIQHDPLVRAALHSWQVGRADFADYLIGELNRAAHCRETVTFDRALMNSEGFLVVR